MNMDDVKEPIENQPTENLQNQLKVAKDEIQSLTQQLNCLLLLTKNAWRGDASATTHLARVIGIDSEVEQNEFMERKTTTSSTTKKSVTILDNEERHSKRTPSIASSASQDTLIEQHQERIQSAARNSYLQPFFRQGHIDPIHEQNSRQIFNNMIRHHQNEINKTPIIINRNSLSNVRPRATKHLYRPATADHIVRHLGSPLSRAKPYFVFAGKEFFRKTTNYSPLYQRAVFTSNGSRQSQHSELSDDSEIIASSSTDQVNLRPQTAKLNQQSSTLRFNNRTTDSQVSGRTSSALSSASTSKMKQLTERERRDAMRLQRQLSLPRQGWVNQRS